MIRRSRLLEGKVENVDADLEPEKGSFWDVCVEYYLYLMIFHERTKYCTKEKTSTLLASFKNK